MKSPAHPDTKMEQHELESGLLAWRCPISKGYWITSPSYWLWHSQQNNDFTPKSEETTEDSAQETDTQISNLDRAAMLCPESHCLLVRYHVGKSLGFYIDRSPSTGGIWLDDGEWQALKKKGIHASLHMIFNSSYQKKVRVEEAQKSLSEIFFKDLTIEDREQLETFNTWLLKQPTRRRISAWLQEQIEHNE